MRDLGIPKSSASRLLKALSTSGLLERDPEGGYVAGPQTLLMANLYLGRHDLLDAADRTVRALVEAFGHTGYLSKLDGDGIVLLRVRQGAYPLRHVREVGTRLPALRTAMGRVLLAREADDTVAAVMRRDGLSDADARGVASSLAEARRSGVLVMASALTPGITTIAAVASDPGRRERVAIGLAYPDNAADAERAERMRVHLRQAAWDLGNRLGDRAWSNEEPQA